jgi:phenylpropionate dioxygenase-like ring-hydroxylating dioxygenase large terminal subunit
MTTLSENELLTRTGPGTPMGETLRRYWMPALLSWEIGEPDSPPVNVKLLGENLVAFRDTQGRVGLLNEVCPHRCASLWLGRNEENGLRCVFHGWKFDVDGNCLEMPNEVPENQFAERIHARAYPTVEMGGIVWAYMGPREKMPAPPMFEFTQVPETHLQVNKTLEECNWLQGLEGGIDSIHSSFLHRSLTGQANNAGLAGLRARAIAAKLEVDVTDYGFLYASIRPINADEGDYIRTYHYVMPFTQIRAAQNEGYGEKRVHGHFWVPMDDENHMVWNWHYSFDGEEMEKWDARMPSYLGGEQVDHFRKRLNKDNKYLIDREMQKAENYTGIQGINTQDHAIQESMGPIVDRTKEHLVPTDRAVITARNILLRAAKTVQEGGDPPGVADTYWGIRAIEDIVPPGMDWRDAFRDRLHPREPIFA